ncbi:MAG: mechanosensitive ion channel [Cyanothece sp. SIO1E1]|nr:mechanosensitive ion channel [Cyanothece sp. SIO1E1]
MLCSHQIQRLACLILTLLACWCLYLNPVAWGQTAAFAAAQPTAKVSVVLEGRSLFKIGGIEGFTAQERATFANQVLQRQVERLPLVVPTRVKILKRGNLITLRVGGRHLLTITESDLITGITAAEQAEMWADRLQRALDRANYERTSTYRRQAWGWSLGSILLAVGVHVLMRQIRRRVRRQATREMAKEASRHFLIQIGISCGQGGMWIAVVLFLGSLFPKLRSGQYVIAQLVQETFTTSIVIFGEQGYSILDLGQLLALLIGLWITVRALTGLIRSRFLQATGAGREVQDAIANLIQIPLMILGLLILLQAVGVDISSLAILASVLGVGIGFGLRDIANNFVSGLVILLERPIQVGDFVQLEDLTGTVERIGMRSTEIMTLDRVSIIVPNSDVIQNKVINWSHRHPVCRLHIPLGVAYHSNIKQVRQAVLEAAKLHPEVLQYPHAQLWFQGFGESALKFDLLVWIRDPQHQFQIQSDLYYLLAANLRRYQIEIPFPQRDLHLRSPHWDVFRQNGPQPPSVVDSKVDAAVTKPKHTSPATAAAHASDISADVSELLDWLALEQTTDILPEAEMQALIAQMRGENGLDIRDRRFGLQVYAKCFIGSDAVKWFMQHQIASREEAVRLGQILLERGIIHHVIDEHAFKDDYLFYRFYVDEA